MHFVQITMWFDIDAYKVCPDYFDECGPPPDPILHNQRHNLVFVPTISGRRPQQNGLADVPN